MLRLLDGQGIPKYKRNLRKTNMENMNMSCTNLESEVRHGKAINNEKGPKKNNSVGFFLRGQKLAKIDNTFGVLSKFARIGLKKIKPRIDFVSN